jgi:hypothetical protein
MLLRTTHPNQRRWIGFAEDDAKPNRRRRKYLGEAAFVCQRVPTSLNPLRCSGAADQEAHEKINNDRGGNGKEERTNKGGPERRPNNA